MHRLDQHLYESHRAKLSVNGTYVYAIHLVHVLLDLLPGFLRTVIFRILLGKMGRNVFIDYRVYFKFPWLVEIGNDVSVNRGAEFYPDYFGRKRIVLGSNIRIAPHVRFHASGHEIEDLRYRHVGEAIEVEDDVWIGAGSIILPGTRIGARSIIGAGSVVTSNIPADSVAVGVPARVIRKRDPL